MERIYLDNAATTRVTAPVMAVQAAPADHDRNLRQPYASIHSFGREARRRPLEKARCQVAAAHRTQRTEEIYFTAGGSESDNWALQAA